MVKKYGICFFIFFFLLSPVSKAQYEIDVTQRDAIIGASFFIAGLGAAVIARLIVSGLLGKEKINKIDSVEHENQDIEKEPELIQYSLPYIIYNPERLSDLIGQDRVVREACDFLEEVSYNDEFKSLGAKKVKALFIDGPQGNGKTLLVRAIAGELNCCLIPINGYFFSDTSPEVSEAKIRLTFDFAKRMSFGQASIILIDGIDVFAGIDEFYKFDIGRRRVVKELINQIKGLGEEDNVIVIATARSNVSLDSDLFMPGCLDRSIHISLPSFDGRKEILEHYINKTCLQEVLTENDFTKLAENTAGFNSSLLKDVACESALIAGVNGDDCVQVSHIHKAVEKIKLKKQELFDSGKEELFYYTFCEKTRFDDVIGHEQALTEIEEYISFLKTPENYAKVGARRPRGLLLHGPSGCGKTLIARAIAGESGCCFVSVSGSEFVKKYVGTGASNVRSIFNFARRMSKEVPVIIFIDEIDGLGRRQGADSSSASTEYNNTINEMLKQMDGFTKDENILIVGATNLIQELDPALLRSGRFDRKVVIGLPGKEDRSSILKHYIKKIAVSSQGLSKKISEKFSGLTIGFSGADLENLVNESAILAARLEKDFVTINHFEQALDKIILGLKTKIKQTKDQLNVTAYHEAGHALAATVFGLPVEKITILPRGNSLGVTMFQKKYESFSFYKKSELIHELIKYYGGFAAEKIIFGEVSPGVSDDLKQSGKLAHNMVHKFGMGGDDLEGVPGLIFEDRKIIDKEVAKILRTAYEKTKYVLQKHKDLLVMLAERLLQRETLNEEEVFQIVGSVSGCELVCD